MRHPQQRLAARYDRRLIVKVEGSFEPFRRRQYRGGG